MAIIPGFFMNAVVALGVDGTNGEKHWIGTGFIVGRKEIDNPTLSTYYIITNKHVIQNQAYIYVRFNSLGEAFVKDYRIDLNNGDGEPVFSAHPNDKTDIIAMQILPQTLIDDKSIWGAFSLEDNSYTLDEMQKSGIFEGNIVFALGFPMNLVSDISAPICRIGCISRIKEAYVEKENEPQFLVDAQVFPGNSGGPIVCPPESIWLTNIPHSIDARLIGILSGYIRYKDALISQQTKEPVMIREENSGLTIVHPVDRIKEVVELEWARNEKRKVASAPASLPAPQNEKEEAAV